MKKFEYKVISPRNEIHAIRASENPRHTDGDEVLLIEILNSFGSQGWRVTNPSNGLEIYLEREYEGRPVQESNGSDLRYKTRGKGTERIAQEVK